RGESKGYPRRRSWSHVKELGPLPNHRRTSAVGWDRLVREPPQPSLCPGSDPPAGGAWDTDLHAFDGLTRNRSSVKIGDIRVDPCPIRNDYVTTRARS